MPFARDGSSFATPGVRLLATLVTALAACSIGGETQGPAGTAGGERHPGTATDWAGHRLPREGPGRQANGPFAKHTWVLHIGDSFVDASFQQNLEPRFQSVGAKYVAASATATYTTTWAYEHRDLDRWLAQHPSLVLVTLGANEVDMPIPVEHADAVQRLSRKIARAHATCVWITPPMWKRETGILQVIHDHAAPCLFVDSDALLGGLQPDERQRDHVHPNERGGARWSEAVWGWLLDHRDTARPGFALQPFELRER